MFTHYPHPAFCLADLLIFGGSAVAMRWGILTASEQPFDWQGLNGFVMAIGALSTALGALYLKIRDNSGEIQRLTEAYNAAHAKIDEAKREAESKIEAARLEAENKAEAKLVILREQNAKQQADIDHLRKRGHDLADNQQVLTSNQEEIKQAIATKILTPDPDKPINVIVTNDLGHPVPVSTKSKPDPSPNL